MTRNGSGGGSHTIGPIGDLEVAANQRRKILAVGSAGTVLHLFGAMLLASIGEPALMAVILSASALTGCSTWLGLRTDRPDLAGHGITFSLLLNIGTVSLLSGGTAAGDVVPLVIVPLVAHLLIVGRARHFWPIATIALVGLTGLVPLLVEEPPLRIPFMETTASLLQGTAAGVLACWVVVAIEERNRTATLQRLRESEERAYRVVELSPDPICITRDHHVVFANQAAEKLIGRPIAPGREAAYSELRGYKPDPKSIASIMQRFDAGERFVTHELSVHDAEGRRLRLELRATRIEIGGVQHALNILRDVTEAHNERRTLALIHTITAIANEASDLDEALNRSAEALMDSLHAAAVIYWQPEPDDPGAFCATALAARADVPESRGWLGARLDERLALDPDAAGSDFTPTFERPGADVDVETDTLLTSIVPIRSRDQVVGLLECVEDAGSRPLEGFEPVITDIGLQLGQVAERERARADISKLAYFDSLTGLPNRQHFQQALEEGLAHSSARDERAALLFVDLDGFKEVNDSMGHGAGDRLLREVARRLRGSLRLTDLLGRASGADTTTVARLGGDEFTVLLSDVKDAEGARRVADRIIHALGSPFQIEDNPIHMTASVGIALYPDDARQASELLGAADAAMYEAKSQGRNGYQFFSRERGPDSARLLKLKSMFRRALDTGEFQMAYQPIVDARTREVISAEALIRWTTAEGEVISPAEFIPVAEKEGFISAVGEWVLHDVGQQIQAWREDGFQTVPIAVNVSASQLFDPRFVELVCSVLERCDLEPSALSMEITETAILQEGGATSETLAELRRRGFQLVLDDFGTGYSSLSALQKVPVHSLKIDRSFVLGLPNASDEAIVSAIVGMGHGLHARVVAEGVETEEQLAVLQGFDCDRIQGYLISPPIPADAFERFLVRKVEAVGAEPDGDPATS